MNSEHMTALIAEVLSGVLQRPVPPGEYVSRATEERWDSLKHMEIIFAIEAATGLQISEEEIALIMDTTGLQTTFERAHAA